MGERKGLVNSRRAFCPDLVSGKAITAVVTMVVLHFIMAADPSVAPDVPSVTLTQEIGLHALKQKPLKH